MNTGPDFLDQSSARWRAFLELTCFLVVMGILGSIVWLLPEVLGQAQLWLWAGLATAGALLTIWAFTHGPTLFRGGVYCVEIRAGRLRFNCSNRSLGTSFEVPITEIERLVHRYDADGLAGHEIHTRSRETFDVSWPCAGRLFEAILRLRPDLADKQGTMGSLQGSTRSN